MFDSEVASLSALEKTNTIRVPHPIGVVEGSHNTYFCVLEFVEIRDLGRFATALGEKLAALHLHNENVAKGTDNYVKQFGFPMTTCVGLLPTNNSWCDDWSVRRHFHVPLLQWGIECNTFDLLLLVEIHVADVLHE